ncbi:helix-turn-helix domain-containing protein [Tsuneonella mangrovi]|uniref:helix-turn-helix domain-containing protein n=1 Tax=Tsuneonella mangrovi TaxID=1982042 RepID=UPI000BA2B827|nr:helix-turn-helix domain-containing protein [Tsuneonella mangrovi]
MPIDARFEFRNDNERREAPRRILRLGITGRTSGSDGAQAATVRNISATGMLIECATELSTGDSIAVILPEAGEREAHVVWAEAPMFGCQFSEPLSDAMLSAAELAGEIGLPSPATDEDFGERLHRLRTERGLSLGDIADKLGVSKPTVWAWEHGKSRPIERRLAGLAEVLGVTPAGLQPAPPSQDEIIARHRQRLAEMYGVDPERVRILIEL